MNAALASAKGQIDAAVRGSFLQARGEPIFIRVHDGPASLSTARSERLEGLRGQMESKTIAQAAQEFDSLTHAVVGELRRALHSSFLGQAMDVKVKASNIAWPSTIALLRGTESNRDASERAFDGKVVDLQTQYLRQLNGMIAKALA